MTLQLGTVRPGSTIYIPFATYDKDDGSSITMTGLAVTDIEVYKDGSVTQRSSDNGYTLLDTDGIDFDGVTGQHGFSISLADNSDAGFYSAGSRYFVWVSSITVDSVTVTFLAAVFDIGYPDAVLNTTIATLASQTSFTLTAGPAENDALNGCVVRIHDVASAVQAGFAVVLDYTGSTRTVTLAAGTTFTAATTDNVSFYPPANVGYWASTAVASPHTAGYPVVTVKDGTGTGEIDTTSGGVLVAALANNAITAAAINADAITAAKLHSDVTTELQSGLATAAELAKVPKSDGTASWNATALAALQSEANDALVAYDPPTRAEATSDKDEMIAAVGALDSTLGGVGDYLSVLILKIGETPGVTGNDSTHIHLQGRGGDYDDDELNDLLIVIYNDGNGPYPRWISDWDQSDELATLHEALPFTPDGDSTYALLSIRRDVTGGSGPSAADIRTEMDDNSTKLAAILTDTAEIGAAGAGLTAINLPNQTMDIVGNITGNLSGSVGSVATGGIAAASFAAGAIDAAAIAANAIGSSELADGAITSAKFAAGAITATVIATDAIDDDAIATGAIASTAFAAGAITASAIATDAIGAAELADGAITAATFAAGAIDAAAIAANAIDAATFAADVDAEARGWLGMASANLDTQLADIETKVDDLETRLGTPSDLGSGATVAANLVDIEGQTDDIGVAGAGLTALATAAELAKVPKSDSNVGWNATARAQIQQEAEDALAAYDPPTKAELDAGLAAADDAVLAAIAALNNLSSAQAQTAAAAALTAYDPPTHAETLALLTTAMTESYSADGATMTPAQALYLIAQRLTEFAISGTTISIKKLDGTTEAATLTLDDEDSPTSSTRAT